MKIKHAAHTHKFSPPEKAPRVAALISEGRARAARVRGCEPRRDEHLTLSSRLSRSQGWMNDSAQPTKGQCTSSSCSCNIQLTEPSTLAKFSINNYHLFTSLAESDFRPFSLFTLYGTRWCFQVN
jgi:hypothetical protein